MNESQKFAAGARPERVQVQPPPSDRGDEWLSEFNSQIADRGLYRRALHAARSSVSLLQQAGAQVASSFAEDLLASAIADTWFGVLSWDPGEATLLDHVQDAIRSRARDEWRRAKRFPSASLDACEEDEEEDERAAALWTDVEEALAANAPTMDARQRLLALEAFDRVRALAVRDRELVTALDTMRKGHTERADLMRVLGWSARHYDRVRRRLDRLLRELPAGMRERVPAPCSCASAPHGMRRTAVPCGATRHRVTGDGSEGTPAAPHVPEPGSGRVRKCSPHPPRHGFTQTTQPQPEN
jgi:hypothetical protein